MVSESATNSKKERVIGQSALPLARVKRIIKEDPDVSLINVEATHCIASATELFMEYLVNEGYSRAQKNKRKTVFYKDLASAVSQTDPLEFLEDVIPTTMTLEEAYRRRDQPDDDTGKDDQVTSVAKRRKLQFKPSTPKQQQQQQQQEEEMETDSSQQQQQQQQQDNNDDDEEEEDGEEEEDAEEEEDDDQDVEDEEDDEEEEE
ncbi:histone-fold-containing protein [Absidia repens]|uniref:Histone-fold-containing protein n=1 Tax=Absidia repens TaxID=90262 RepID=A0A1X2ICE6_9FUNG|nr:histone-fold-containing protein [Absidia repens]